MSIGKRLDLKELTTRTLQLFGVSKPADLPSAILCVCTNNDFSYYEQFLDLVEDLETDWLQMVFQYHLADRKVNKQDYTPKSICKLLAAETEIRGNVVYDLCAGSGALTIQKWACNGQNKVFICEELDEKVVPILLFNMAIRNMNGYVVNRNALSLETYRVYRLKKGERFSTVESSSFVPSIDADEIVSNPPYNIKWDAPEPLIADSRFFAKSIPPASSANYAFVMTALDRMKMNGRCAFVLPCGVLSSDQEREVREYLVENGLIERVILLPEKMFESTSIPTCVMVFSHGNGSVKFYDCRKKAVQEQRLQNGQFGGASHENRAYVKNVNIIPDELIAEVCGECDNVAGFSQEVAICDIKKSDYSLMASKYIQLDVQEIGHRPYVDIMADINRIASERSRVKITVNETIAKQLGLYEVAQLSADSENAELNATFNLLGGKYESKRYIALSKVKNEFKFENQDKEMLSSLVNFIIPMWKQHIFYLNREENRLLGELRDALLPDLMSGKIQIADEALEAL